MSCRVCTNKSSRVLIGVEKRPMVKILRFTAGIVGRRHVSERKERCGHADACRRSGPSRNQRHDGAPVPDDRPGRSRERHFSGWRVLPHETRESVTDEQRNQALAVDRYGARRRGHPHLRRGLGPADRAAQFRVWRMDVAHARCRSPRRRIARPIGCRCPSHRQLAPPTSPSTIASPSPAPARRRRSRGAENPALISLRQHEVRPPRRRLGSVDEYRTLVPTLVLAAAVAANEPPPQAEPQATGATNERAAVNELRPAQDLRPQEKRPAVRVILASPYATPR